MRYLPQTPATRNAVIGGGIAAIIALVVGFWLWQQKPEYKVLFSNFSDRDGGAIVASLQQMNVPYKYSDGGTAILVPEDQVHDTRLKLAAQGLPKGGNVGFELMENQKLGISQFLEQVNYQRALEGELARSIQSVAAIQSARVHLAMPKASVFVREQQKPTASVLLNLHPGRSLDQQQVSAIVHLVASSVPDLPPKNVTVVDQNGNLLSETDKKPKNGMDPTQLKYVQELQQNIVSRVESIITPIVGPNNVRAEATADVDFSSSEQAAEVYKPNQTPDAAAVRSQHSSESRSASSNNSGVPGALTNQPPGPSTAPVANPQTAAQAANQQPQPGQPGVGTAMAPPPVNAGNMQKDTTTNYEVDKTVRYVQQPMGGIKRLTVAVVVNYKRVVDAKTGKSTMRPLTDAEKTEITDLVKEAMGYNKERGDSVNVVNSPFSMDQDPEPEIPLWKRPEMWELGKEIGRYLLLAIAIGFIYFKLLKPLLKKNEPEGNTEPGLLAAPQLDENGNPILPEEAQIDELADDDPLAVPQPGTTQKRLEAAKKLAKEQPKIVAQVVKEWIAE
jgi:flagellar M-ring protein FliF